MIRINLISRKGGAKQAQGLRNVIIAGVLLTVVLAGIGYKWVSMNGKISTLQRQIRDANDEREKLKDVKKDKTTYEQNIAKLKSQLDIIAKIKEQRFLPIRLFDELTKVLDRNTPVWLERYSFNSNSDITMNGNSLTNANLADFVTRMERTPFFQNVDLLFSQKKKVEDREIYSFGLKARPQTEGTLGQEPGVE